MTNIEPNPKLNKILAGLICVFAVFPLYLGFYSMTFLPLEEWTWSAVPIAIGALILAAAVYAWRKPPINAARITFCEGGFRLEIRQVFRGERVFDLNWADISKITTANGGLYGGRWMRIFHGKGKENALFSPSWTNSDTVRIIERLDASAGAAGYTLDKEPGFWKSLVNERWLVRKTA